ncbi:MAG: helicase HerA-like domain-containing protein [Alphaproteobacteria bacterium]|nr:helicase HerA-like domain-containing protein [Alphaproteobacteria bacterium]
MGVFDSTSGSTAAPNATVTGSAVLIADGASGAISLPLKMANRHGLIAGATGTGKTVSLQRVAEQMARAGVPVLCVDVKGDLSGIVAPNSGTGPAPVFWDVYGKEGHPVRTTVSEFGPMLFCRLLNLSDAQAGVLQIAFKIADDQQLLLLDLKDLKAMLSYMSEHTAEIGKHYGLVSPTSISGIQREILTFENESGALFFGEPALDVTELLMNDSGGNGCLHVLMANQLMRQPRLYATIMLWLLAELFEKLPEVGDQPKPKLALFIDEAHLLFNDAPQVLVEKLEQVIRLIRSKGVGIYFITQNPLDLPETILGQLGHRIQHALRAFTPKDQKSVRAAAETFRANPAFNTEEVITQLGVGEALISFLDEKGTPSVVEKAKVKLPLSKLGPISTADRSTVIAASPFAGTYDQVVDRESAYERLTGRVGQAQQNVQQQQQMPQQATGTDGGILGGLLGAAGGLFTGGGNSRRQGVGEALVKSVVRSVGSQVGREIMRGIMGSIRSR